MGNKEGRELNRKIKINKKRNESIFLIYLKKIFGKWYFIIGIYFTALEVISKAIGKDISIPTIIIFGSYILGFFYSSFTVYKELFLSIPDEYQPENPIVELELIEGNSYNYYFDKTNNDDNLENQKYMMKIKDGELPKGIIKINARILNSSSKEIKITSIEGNMEENLDNKFYEVMLPEVLSNSQKVKFPIIVEAKETLNIQFVSSMHPSNRTEAQIAVRTSKKNKMNMHFKTKIDFIFGNNEERVIEDKFDISINPFAEMLINYWMKNGNDEITKLTKLV